MNFKLLNRVMAPLQASFSPLIKNSVVVVIFILIFTSCSLKVTKNISVKNLEMQDTTLPISIYTNWNNIPANTINIGSLFIEESGITMNCDSATVFDLAAVETRKAGGNALYLKEHQRPSFFGSSCHQIKGDMLHIPAVQMNNDTEILAGLTSSEPPPAIQQSNSQNVANIGGVVNSNLDTNKTAINIGVLMGGGSLVGLDLEALIYKNLGLQVGAGVSSFGAGLNFHFKPYINTQFLSIQYFNQGFGNNHFGSYIGPMYVFRAKTLFQAGIGLGSVLTKGPLWDWSKDTDIILLYNIGIYFSF